MPLDGKTFQQIQDALLDSFFNKSDLAQMVKRELGEDLDHIAGGETFKEITFNLLRWAETQDKVDLLLKNAHEYNPNNRSLRAVVEKFDPITQTSEDSPVEREKSKVGMWLGLAVLLIVVVFAGKLMMDRTPSKNSNRPGIRRPLKLSPAQKKLQQWLDLTKDTLKYDTKGHTSTAEYYLERAEDIAPDDPEVKKMRIIVDKRRRSADGE